MAPSSSRRITANCIAHARRYFIEAYQAFPEHCERVLEDIATIYQHDDKTRRMDPHQRLVYHQENSRPVMEALYDWIEEQFRERVVEPNSRLGKAFSYVKNHWRGLTRFFEVPGVPLDNNALYAARGISFVMPRPRLCRVSVPISSVSTDLGNTFVVGAA